MVTYFLSILTHKSEVISAISLLGVYITSCLYIRYQGEYKYIGEYKPDADNPLFSITSIMMAISASFLYLMFDERLVKLLCAMILVVMFLMNLISLFTFLESKNNKKVYKFVLLFLFLILISTVLVILTLLLFIKKN